MARIATTSCTDRSRHTPTTLSGPTPRARSRWARRFALALEFGVADALETEEDSHRVGGCRDLSREPFVQQSDGRHVNGIAPLGQEYLGVRQHDRGRIAVGAIAVAVAEVYRAHSPLGVATADPPRSDRQHKPVRVGGDNQWQVGGAVVHGLGDVHRAPVQYVEVEVVEQDVDQLLLPAGVTLDRRGRVPPVRPHRHLLGERRPDQFPPRRGCGRGGERHQVEEHAPDLVAACRLDAPVGRQPGVEPGLVGQLAQYGQVRGQQDALEWRAGLPAQCPQGRKQRADRDPQVVREHLGGRRVGPRGRKPQRLVVADPVGPELAGVGRGDGSPFQSHEVGEPSGVERSLLYGLAVTDRPVHREQLGDQRVVAPAVEDRVALHPAEPPAGAGELVQVQPEQRWPVEIEPTVPVGVDRTERDGVPLSGCQFPQVREVDLDVDPGVYELQRLGVRRRSKPVRSTSCRSTTTGAARRSASGRSGAPSSITYAVTLWYGRSAWSPTSS